VSDRRHIGVAVGLAWVLVGAVVGLTVAGARHPTVALGAVTPTDPTDPTDPAPTLVADPIVSSGGVARVSGQGFTPGATVRLTWVLPDGSTAPGGLTTVVAADGSITTSCLVLTHARLGPRTLRAEQGKLAASAPVLVVNGPMEPGRNRLLGRR
jgi:hypothetical protein